MKCEAYNFIEVFFSANIFLDRNTGTKVSFVNFLVLESHSGDTLERSFYEIFKFKNQFSKTGLEA